ncbi:receptor-type tyrosine-protein phosphatase V isoform X1 [Xenopus tropicalis]|uniref:protein-tyrosine-phosphatase n=1 Tax=Xenopus tropicalis TaxID=8364 RepID=A0A8J0QLL9_XENTR|nr:receptor-type tyrosine-protein phosphatase V isoform X1 [Xenopus tropicalis]|eukprot:XP_002933047.2 PREDICTED: receptor-type tyrosine-protein phosphatase V-like isoform X2 [Xenopus tropicalis]
MESRDFSRAMPVCSFQEMFYMKQKDENNIFIKEFKELTDVGNDQSKEAAETPANAMKNRYAHILPYDHTQVKLSLIDGNLDSGYINANYIPGFGDGKEYIATQAPLPATFVDFWRMIWEQRVRIIVMLTVCEEQGKVLCDQYWPADTVSYGLIAVHKVSELHSKDWTIRHFTIQKINNADTSARSIYQLHYTTWPDRGVPINPVSLVTFVEFVREHVQAVKDSGPTVLHCSAGVGRTGTFIALDVALQQLNAGQCIDIFQTVHKMRLSRYLMLQTEEQYIFVHYCILEKIVQKVEPHTAVQ